MASRKFVLGTGEIYHIFNRSIARQPIFTSSKAMHRFLHITDFYRFENPPMRYSHVTQLQPILQTQVLNNLYETGIKAVEIFAFSLMPNHFHFLIRQNGESGIKNFLSKIQNSYAKYYNTRTDRTGSVFQEMFKAVRIETDEQFLHIGRYIHLNPVTAYILKYPSELEAYPWTSFSTYMERVNNSFLNTDMLLSHFKNAAELRKFTFDQVDYQRELDKIKHLTLE